MNERKVNMKKLSVSDEKTYNSNVNHADDMRPKHYADIPSVCPLTDVQRGIYLECIDDPSSLIYNICFLFRLPATVDRTRFLQATKIAVQAHKILNVVIGTPNGVPSMIYKERDVEIEEKNVDDIYAESMAFNQPFDLENGPLYRFALCHTPDGLIMLLTSHHIISDGTSFGVLLKDILCAYNTGSCPEEELTPFDIAIAETHEKDPALVARAKDFFKKKLEGVDLDLQPMSDVVSASLPTGAGQIHIDIGERIHTKDVETYCRENNISENAFFLGAFAYSLAKFSGTSESFFCTVHHGRNDKRLASTFGMFVRTLPIYTSFDEKMKTADFLSAIYEEYYQVKHHDAVSFGELCTTYGIKNKITFVFHGNLFNDISWGNDFVSLEIADQKDTSVDLDTMLLRDKDSYHLLSHYRRSVYTEGFVKSFSNCFIQVAEEMLTAKTLADISLLDDESHKLLDCFNHTEAPYEKDATVVDLFRKQAAKTPDNICLVFNEKKYTYHEVDQLTDVLAQHLVSLGVGCGKIVGVLIPRCEYMLLCSLGILKAGGAYLPLDPTYPPERLNLMVADSRAMMLIYAPALANVITADFKGIQMSTDEISTLTDQHIVLPTPAPNDLFIMLYTSGSTGLPKGVPFTHANMAVTTAWFKKYFSIDENAHVTAYASYGFDANTADTYPAITSGAQLHIIADDLRLDFPALKKYFNDNSITHAIMTTQIGRAFAQIGGLKTLRHLSVAGEKLTPLAVPEGFALYNLYGPTEGSVITSAFAIKGAYRDVPIGKPVDNLKAYIVDKNGHLLPAGAIGECWIAGPHVTPGYLNRPEKTAQAYGENPFDTENGYERIYRTGDIVRFLEDGNLQFVGRRDAQVKIRGFRVECTEIEEVIRRFPDIRDATVTAFDDPAGGKFIAAYIVSDKKIAVDALADFIRAEKPPYMVPAAITQIDAIPLTQNQKVNKKALPIPKREVGQVILPENETQQKIFDIVAEVLCHRDFGINTDLYEAGLTSIGSVKLNVSLADAFSLPIRIADIKANPTIRQLEHFIATLPTKEKENFSMPLSDYPLTETQKGIFVECLAMPGTTVYNIPVLLRLGKGVDLGRLAAAIRTTLDAHPYVKTTFLTNKSGDIRAKRQDNADVCIETVSCQDLPSSSALVRPFALIGAPLYRIALYHTPNGNYLFMDFHHILCDGVSEAILFEDINRAYAGESLTKESFTGYEQAVEEQAIAAKGEYRQAKDYWAGLLSGCETDCLPKKDPEGSDSSIGSVRKTVCDADVSQKILTYCQENHLSLNAFFNGAFAFVLSRFIGKDTLSYATVYNGRNDSRLNRTVSFLVKTLPVVANIPEKEEFLPFLRDLQAQLLKSMANDACPFAELSHDYGVKADILFVYQGEMLGFDSIGGEAVEWIDVPANAAKAPLSVNVFLQSGHFDVTVEYRPHLYSRAFAESLAETLGKAAERMTQCQKIQDISLLSARGEELYQALNQRSFSIEKLFVPELIERAAATSPDAVAIIDMRGTMTYREFNESANIVAHALIERGVGRESIIGIIFERNRDVYIAELAILKAGGAFLPILPSYPDERIDYCLCNSDCPYVITSKELAEKRRTLLTGKPYAAIFLEELLTGDNKQNPALEILPNQLAYCIYTSGSTGTPKGVMIEHGNFTHSIQTNRLSLNYCMDDSFTGSAMSISSISFDMSIYESYLPLCYGRPLFICTEEEYHTPLLLQPLMIKHRVQMMTCTPSFLNNIIGIPAFAHAIRQCKTVIVGAEAFPEALYTSLRSLSPDLQIVNGYGPTECSMCCSTKELTDTARITIGKPTHNLAMYVIDRFGHILPPYAVGELIICGDGVGRGYVKLPEKTAASFFTLRGRRAYHSGDLVRLCGNAEIDFGGRMDNQVKLRGFRVELDEIEKAINAYPTVRQSKVIVRNNGTEDYLAAFFTADESVDIPSLTVHLQSKLTYYMVPAVLHQLDTMPLTPNGKIDKKALPEIKQGIAKKAGRRAPKKSLEERLCEIFRSILNADEIYADDNFFALGGTSLSASKVTMLLMSEGMDVKYGDIFDHPTPETLADFIESRKVGKKDPSPAARQMRKTTRPALQWNTIKYAREVKYEPLGDVLLTGAVGFLGIHVLKELLTSETESGHIYCLVRRGHFTSAEKRLKTMLVYYFDQDFEEEFLHRITVVEADITDTALGDTLQGLHFDTVINCAACVKHFSDSNILEEINVHGVENLISLCQARSAKLVQISTVSIPGIHTPESYEKQVRMHENELFVIDDMENKYIQSKYHAELRMLDAIENGLRGKIIRVGNLMGRHSDGEFQINMESNMFMSGIRGFAVLGKYPISHMTDPMSFSPIDCTARAVVLLAGTNDKFTAFHANTRYGFDEMKIIDACNRNGISIVPTDDEKYYAEFQKKLGDDRINKALNGLAAYDIKEAHAVDTDNLFTTNILYRIGFSWPLVDDAYLDRTIHSIMTLGYFNMNDIDAEE